MHYTGVIKTAARFRSHYAAKKKNGSPGVEDIHLIYLKDLAEILRVNSHQFLPVIADTDKWIATLEAIRVPRNLVGHMNFPNAFDKAAIDSTYSQLPSLLGQLTAKSVPILIPK